MKRSGKNLIWLACAMIFCAVSRADAQMGMSQMGATPEQREALHEKIMELRHQHGLKTNGEAMSNATNPDVLRQKMTLENRMALGQQNGMQPLSTRAASGIAPANTAPTEHNAEGSTPYGSIAVRNVFALNPIPPPGPAEPIDTTPPPKITLTGITTIFGPAEALYKVGAYNKNGKQVPDQSYILTEGEGQDDVEVTAIDTQKNIVTFNNHGETQVIPLTDGVATGGGSGPSGGPGGPPGMMRRFGGGFPRPGGGPGGFQPRVGGGYNGGGFNNPNGNSPSSYGQQVNSSGSGYSSSYNNTYNNNTYNNNNNSDNNNASSQPDLSPDDQAALIAAQHAAAIADNKAYSILFPPTKYDSDAGIPPSGGTSSGGSGTAK
jgi:hypothetical protein